MKRRQFIGTMATLDRLDSAEGRRTIKAGQVANAIKPWNPGDRLDDYQTNLVEGRLTKVENKVREVLLVQQRWASGTLIPIEVSDDEDTDFITHEIMTSVGSFRQIRNYTTSIPAVDVMFRRVTREVYSFAGSYNISEEEMKRMTRLAGYNIEDRKVKVVTDIGEQTLNSLIYCGRTRMDAAGEKSGFDGIINHPNVIHSMAPYGINGSRTPQEIIALLNDLVNTPSQMTNGMETVNVVGMTIAAHNYISNTPYSTLNGTSIKAIWLGNQPGVRIVEIPELKGWGQGGTDILMAWRSDPDAFKVDLIQPLKFRPLVQKEMHFTRYAKFRYGGIAMYRPMSVHIMHGL